MKSKKFNVPEQYIEGAAMSNIALTAHPTQYNVTLPGQPSTNMTASSKNTANITADHITASNIIARKIATDITAQENFQIVLALYPQQRDILFHALIDGGANFGLVPGKYDAVDELVRAALFILWLRNCCCTTHTDETRLTGSVYLAWRHASGVVEQLMNTYAMIGRGLTDLFKTEISGEKKKFDGYFEELEIRHALEKATAMKNDLDELVMELRLDAENSIGGII